MNNKKARGLNGVVFLVFVVFLFAALWFTNQFDQREKEITWKNFQQLIQDDKIESVEVNQNKSVPTGRVEITLKETTIPIRSDICMFLMLTRSRII